MPVVWNCGGYESVETLGRLEGRVQVYLPDFKYALTEPARDVFRCGGLPGNGQGGNSGDVPPDRAV